MKLARQGVRDLNGSIPPIEKLPVPVESPIEEPEPGVIHDLIYDDTPEIRTEILARYPEATLEGEYDEIHEKRLTVLIRVSCLDWYVFLLTSGLGGLSFMFQIALREDSKRVAAALDVVRPGWRGRKL